jgi:hypothetical protein
MEEVAWQDVFIDRPIDVTQSDARDDGSFRGRQQIGGPGHG